MNLQRIALVAHDKQKDNLVAFVTKYADQLQRFALCATGTTGAKVHDALPQLDIQRLKSGPLGGDQQIGAMIANDELHGLIFFMDPLTPMPHDVDVKALMRLAVLYDIPMALSRRSAEMLLQYLAAEEAGAVS